MLLRWSFEVKDTIKGCTAFEKFNKSLAKTLPLIEEGRRLAVDPETSSKFNRSEQRVILETSGTTGSRKKVIHNIFSLEYQAKTVSTCLGILSTDRQLAYMPLNYIYGMSVIYTWLYTGSSLALTRLGLSSMSKFFNEIIKNNVTIFSGVPHTYLLLKRWGIENLKGPS